MSAYAKSIESSGSSYVRDSWLRKIRIEFSSKEAIDLEDVDSTRYRRAAQLGGVVKNTGLKVVVDSTAGSNLNISIDGVKKIALTQDAGTLVINNLSYDTIAQIIELRLYRVEIYAGYASSGDMLKIAKGEVSYITQQIHTRHDSALYITYASEMVASWSQGRINFSFRSGINAYSMLQYYFNRNGKECARLSPELKKLAFDEMYRDVGSSANVIESALSGSNVPFVLSTDSTLDDKVIDVTTLAEKRLVPIHPDMINIANGNPTISSQGLDITLFPVINLHPGDILQFGKKGMSMIDTSQGTTNPEGVYSNFPTNYLDPDGCYMVRELRYQLQNRGNNFFFKITAISPKVLGGITGVV